MSNASRWARLIVCDAVIIGAQVFYQSIPVDERVAIIGMLGTVFVVLFGFLNWEAPR